MGGDPRCLPRKGTAPVLRAGSPGEVIRKAFLKPLRMKRIECVKTIKTLEHVAIPDLVVIVTETQKGKVAFSTSYQLVAEGILELRPAAFTFNTLP